jgi:hypothetical protein
LVCTNHRKFSEIQVCQLEFLNDDLNHINSATLVRFKVLTAVKMTSFFWVVTPCGLAGRYQHFKCHFNPEDGDSTFLQNVGTYLQVQTTTTKNNINIPILKYTSVSQVDSGLNVAPQNIKKLENTCEALHKSTENARKPPHTNYN